MKSINQYIQEKLVLTKNIIDKNTRKNYLQFKAIENNCSISMFYTTKPNIEYSFDCKKWRKWDYSDIKLDKGQTIYMRGDNPNEFSISDIEYNQFEFNGQIETSGNIMSLLYKIDFEDKMEIPYEYCFYGLFSGCHTLSSAPELPATKLANSCYEEMFRGCTSLTKAPELPATELFDDCYGGMFLDCTSLTQAPELPATKLSEWCYCDMFYNCKSLTQAPELPATKLSKKCYANMFNGCILLKQKPKIVADIDNNDCKDMFKKCPCEND